MGPYLQGRGPVRRSRSSRSLGMLPLSSSLSLWSSSEESVTSLPPHFHLQTPGEASPWGVWLGRRLARGFCDEVTGPDVIFRTGYQSMPDTHPLSAGPHPAWASAVLGSKCYNPKRNCLLLSCCGVKTWHQSLGRNACSTLSDSAIFIFCWL